MLTLTQYLERILVWLQLNQPSFASSLQPGLTRLQIQEKVQNLPLVLSEEFYELYQWRNGVTYGDENFAIFYPPYTFNSLEFAIEEYYKLIKYAHKFSEQNWVDPAEIWNNKWLPIFSFDKEYICIISDENNIEVSQVLHKLMGGGEPIIKYTSLANMMRTIAECYETGIYYVSEHGDLEIDEIRADQIRLQYNDLFENY
ncbi:SMI1/KNR4 family protein [Nostoc cycadae]|uniref:HEAT domain containing protein n=1 Tax=Nostoc cycadae WK-1 TaxID=1861711 RepID=A0A2H6LF77_9NOSO|nr:SMI1/KNR4 family protein [Nostoc cycadae]GBE91860.1 HEAT domain containing protein [Nostoc cycadae WK-1]